MSTVNIGVLGCASVARRLVIPAMKKVSAIHLKAVASRSAEKATAYAAEFNCRAIVGYDELLQLPDLNAIYIPLPTGLHHQWAHRALDAGKHIFLEKSLASNFSEAKSIVEKAKKKGLLVKENYMFEYHSQQNTVRELMRMQLGRIQLFRASFGFPPLPTDNFRYDKNLGGGALLDAGGYVLKALSTFFPDHISRLRAATLSLGDRGVDISGAIMVDMERDGQCIPAHLAFGFDHHYQCGIEIWGSQAKLSTDRTFTARENFSPSVRVETDAGVIHNSLQTDNHFRNILAHFSDLVLSGSNYTTEYEAILKQAALQDEVRRLAHLCQKYDSAIQSQ